LSPRKVRKHDTRSRIGVLMVMNRETEFGRRIVLKIWRENGESRQEEAATT
jgi:hypothetical protein